MHVIKMPQLLRAANLHLGVQVIGEGFGLQVESMTWARAGGKD